MIVMTSTAGTVRDDIYDEIYDECSRIIAGYNDPDGYHDERTLPIIYEIDDKAEWQDPDCWIKANPNLGVSKKYQYLKDRVDRAKKNQRMVKNLVCKEFNVRETEESVWLDFDELDNRSTFAFGENLTVQIRDQQNEIVEEYTRPMPDYAVGGFDLSVRGDLTAAVISWMYPDDPNLYVESMFWTPQDQLEAHIKSDGVEYDIWAKNGHLRVCPGNEVDYRMVHAWFLEMRTKYDIYLPWIGYDPAYSAYLVDELKRDFGEAALVPVRQGAITLGMPMGTIEKKLKAHRVVYNNNPIMKYNLMCVTVVEDRNGNILPSKRRKSVERIDGFSALLAAWTVMQDRDDEYQGLMR